MGKTRTFYTVRYFNGYTVSTKVFDNKEKALEFSNGDFCDAPVCHRVSKPDTIQSFEKWLENQTSEEMNNNC